MRSLGLALGAALGTIGCSSHVIDAVVEVDACCAEVGAGSGGGGGGGSASDAGITAEAGGIGQFLVHRYKFNGTSSVAVDDVDPIGGNGTIYNALPVDGSLRLNGGLASARPPPYVDLPNHCISRLESATIEVWVGWDGWTSSLDDWQRIFDFGEDFSGGDLDGAPRLVSPNDHTQDGRSYLYLTPRSFNDNVLRLSYLKPEPGYPREAGVTVRETFILAPMEFPTGGVNQVAATFDGETHLMTLYLGGVMVGLPVTVDGSLADIFDINCWLGRSQFPADPLFRGTFYDVRIYSRALTPEQISESARSGPDQLPQ